jgi:predicted RNA-binding Zn ribbon-like protein
VVHNELDPGKEGSVSRSDRPAEFLAEFANTLEIEGAVTTDLIGTAAQLGDWLGERGLLPAGVEVTGDDVALAHELRDGLRAVLASHHDATQPRAEDMDRLAGAAGQLPLRLSFDRVRPHLEPTGDGVRRALGAVLVVVEASVADGSWPRLKLCRADTCQWAFHDTSKNQSRQWCSMRVCGNRQKTRAYRQRRRAPA